jgi:hypothetical protein
VWLLHGVDKAGGGMLAVRCKHVLCSGECRDSARSRAVCAAGAAVHGDAHMPASSVRRAVGPSLAHCHTAVSRVSASPQWVTPLPNLVGHTLINPITCVCGPISLTGTNLSVQ